MATMTDGHPEHVVVTVEPAPGWPAEPAKPVPADGLVQRCRDRRACRRRGGHWWHPADPMIGWFCCQCGAERDGMPRDGT
jgi:hypothetical protein